VIILIYLSLDSRYTLSGHVLTAGARAPIGGVQVTVTQLASNGIQRISVDYTNALGWYSITDIVEGIHTVAISKPNVVSNVATLTIAQDKNVDFIGLYVVLNLSHTAICVNEL
jgi:hypothetical protein